MFLWETLAGSVALKGLQRPLLDEGEIILVYWYNIGLIHI